LPVKRLFGRVLGFALLLGLFALCQPEGAFAQAGSTGGTIGKQDKSISGGVEAEQPKQNLTLIRRSPPDQRSSKTPPSITFGSMAA
jgi:hypothetical protein